MFKNLFGGKKENEEEEIDHSMFSNHEKKEAKTLEDLIEQHAGLSYEKQMLFADVIGSSGWELDMQRGSIFFGQLAFPIQIIGSLSFNNSSWLWGWANKESGMPEELLVQSHQLKALGEEKQIEGLSKDYYTVEEGFEYKIGLMACGVFKSSCYYCANYGQGTLVVTIDDDKIPKVNKDRLEKVVTTFPQLISGVPLNHKNAFKNYLIDRDFQLNQSENQIQGLRNNKVLTADFDDQDRLLNLKGKL